MADLNDDNDDLLSRISRNVEANLENFQQRSAWETASSGRLASASPMTSTKLADDTLTHHADESSTRTLLNDKSYKSISSQHWPSPIGGGPSNNYRSVGPDGGNRSVSPIKPDESTFIRDGSLRSNSILKFADYINQNILLHPFIALRRTCQVNRKCSPIICLQPFSLIPFMYHQQRKQGILALYKGLGSEFLVKGMLIGAEVTAANYADWPTEISSKRRVDHWFKMLALKSFSVAISAPFICSSVVETVQSVIVVKDQPSFVDCLRDGFFRLIHLRSTPSVRMMPIWLIIVPTICYHVGHTVIRYVAQECLDLIRSKNIFGLVARKPRKIIRKQTSVRQSISADLDLNQDLNLTCDLTETSFDEINSIERDSRQISNSIFASFFADVAMLPMETVLNRLYVQGTRTIIDNCDETTVVLPVLTNYDGFTDCYQSIIKFEGNLGVFKGLGAIILEYSIRFMLYRSLHYILSNVKNNRTR